MYSKALVPVFALAASAVIAAPESSKPTGFRFFNQHLTVKPYVSLSYTYDSNVDNDPNKHNADAIFMVNPGVDFDWRGDRWQIAGNAWYRWNGYCENNGRLGANAFGESIAFQGSTATEKGQKGWTLMLSERYAYTSQSDSFGIGTGRGIWRDRDNFDVTAVLERRFTERLHMDVQGQYNYLNYHNTQGEYVPMYGWNRVSVGVEGGVVVSKWTDVLLSVGYNYYNQDRSRSEYQLSRDYSNHMNSWSVMGGLGTHLTRQISYRALAGYSWVTYGGAYNDSGFTYSLSGNWRIMRNLQTSVLGSSYYQPNEYTIGSANKMYTLSWGLSYLALGDKLTLTSDLAYRHNENIYADSVLSNAGWANYNEDYLSFRIGGNYTLNRWLSIFATLSYDYVWCQHHANYDYDRFRGTVGVRLHY